MERQIRRMLHIRGMKGIHTIGVWTATATVCRRIIGGKCPALQPLVASLRTPPMNQWGPLTLPAQRYRRGSTGRPKNVSMQGERVDVQLADFPFVEVSLGSPGGSTWSRRGGRSGHSTSLPTRPPIRDGG